MVVETELIHVKDVGQCLVHSECLLNVGYCYHDGARSGREGGGTQRRSANSQDLISVGPWSLKHQMSTGYGEKITEPFFVFRSHFENDKDIKRN